LAHELLQSGLEELFNQLIRPRLRALIQDVYKDQVYLLDEDGYAAAESNDLIRKRFVKASALLHCECCIHHLYGGQAWEALMSGPKSTFTEGNYRTFFGMAIEMLVKPWEKMLGIMKFTEVRFAIFPTREVYSDPCGSSITAWCRTTRSRYSRCRRILVFSDCIWQRSREIPETVSSLNSAQLGCCECFGDIIECARKC
jgi:hypothetical protein